MLNNVFVPWKSMDLSYLEKVGDNSSVPLLPHTVQSPVIHVLIMQPKWDDLFFSWMKDWIPIGAALDIAMNMYTNKTLVAFYPMGNETDFKLVADEFDVMSDMKAGVPRTGYRGIVMSEMKGNRLFLAPEVWAAATNMTLEWEKLTKRRTNDSSVFKLHVKIT